MADDSEDKPSTSKDFSSTKAAIFASFSKLKKWREEQIDQFRNMQLLESQKLIRLSDESQKKFERVLEITAKSPEREKSQNLSLESCNLSSISEKNGSEYYDTLQESSITGHLQRCFDDSSQSTLSASESKANFDSEKSSGFSEVNNSESIGKNLIEKRDKMEKGGSSDCSSVKPKRPFLKKGSGLLRFMPKSATNGQFARNKAFQKSNNPPKRSLHLVQRTLQLKPAIRSQKIPSEHVKHIRFDIPRDSNEIDDESVIESKCNSSAPNSSPESYFSGDNKVDVSACENESLNLSKENKELEEFEMLENYAQNSSFNSDSSVVQMMLQREMPSSQKQYVKPSLKDRNVDSACKEMDRKSENSIFSPKIGLSKCLEEVQARKEILQKVISDINPRIQSLQNEISNFKDETHDDSDMSERCSTPIEDLEKTLSSAALENNSNRGSPEIPVANMYENMDDELLEADSKSCNFNDVLEDSCSDQNGFEEHNSICEIPDINQQGNQSVNDKSKIREKLLELEKEIEIYQEHNAKLSSICKERDDILKKIQKEREDFNKYKETEKKKLEAEIQEERRQIKRQKDTFMRYQKLRKDNPTRKEREELNALRQEVEKLQEELKRQKIKYTSDNRRWKNQLDAAEKERDSFRLENIRLEEQIQDLLAALRSRIKKKDSQINSIQCDKIDDDAVYPNKESSGSKETENHTEAKKASTDITKDSVKVVPKTTTDKKTKAKVRFNLDDEYQNDLENAEASSERQTENLLKDIHSSPEKINENVDHNKNVVVEKDVEVVNLSTISVSVDAEFKEIDHGNKIERMYSSGEREIIFQSGTRKIIRIDGTIKFLFYNGDSKEVFPDKREVYRYVNGVTETHFPDGLEVTEFPNGQVQRRYSDGQKEVKFPDGTTHNIYIDGSEEIHAADGNVINLSVDGTETIEFANGQREIRTATFRRREFPDGSVKIIYDSGRQETRYANGRIRIKDKEGKVIVDTKYLGVSKS